MARFLIMIRKLMFRRHVIVNLCLLLATAILGPSAGAQTTSPEQRASRYLDSVRRQPSLLLAFMREMPKGGDLHNHLTGAIYAESFIRWAAEDGLCVDTKTFQLSEGGCDEEGKAQAKAALEDPVLYRQMVDAYSMRDWSSARESGHDHFFDTFFKFDRATRDHVGDMLAEAAGQAADDRLTYLETMFAPDQGRAIRLGSNLHLSGDFDWTKNLDDIRKDLLGSGLEEVVAAGKRNLDEFEVRMREDLHCGKPNAEPGCGVTVRYLYQVLRGLTPQQVFAQILTGFEMAQADPRVVGFNLVMPEDWHVPMRDFDLHMHMIDGLRKFYPRVHISLHAGELAPGLVPDDGLRFHIRESVEIGHAERIGHGVAVMHERNPIGLLREMATRNVMAEICLTSNDVILNVRGQEHPLPMYLKYGVPVALATDDEGVSRSDMTREYLRAAETYDLSYSQLKRMARTSLEHSFLPGTSLWSDGREFRRVAACAGDSPSQKASAGCGNFLAGSEKARVQWKEEGEFDKFERQY